MSEISRTASSAQILQQDGYEGPMIYPLIGQAMREIGAIGKNSRNEQQQFWYRGVDAVYNALNPVMAKLGLFITPEILDQKREERLSSSNKSLIYSIVTMRYTVYAPDGSFVQLTVIGEGMDSGDKATNKAMSVAMKYAMFQLFMIPTEELQDPDAEVHEVQPRSSQPPVPRQQAPAVVTTQATAPAPAPVQQAAPKAPDTATPKGYLLNEIAFLSQQFGISDKREMNAKFATMRKALIADGVVPDVDRDAMTMDQARQLIAAIHERYLGKKAS